MRQRNDYTLPGLRGEQRAGRDQRGADVFQWGEEEKNTFDEKTIHCAVH